MVSRPLEDTEQAAAHALLGLGQVLGVGEALPRVVLAHDVVVGPRGREQLIIIDGRVRDDGGRRDGAAAARWWRCGGGGVGDVAPGGRRL